MAVLWKQKELLQELQKLEREQLEKLASSDKKGAIPAFYIGNAQFYVAENLLLQRMVMIYEKNLLDAACLIYWRKIIDASVNDKFITQVPNPHFKNIQENKNGLDPDESSLRLLQVSPDKGMELMDRWYFWLKFIPETLKPLEQIVVQVVISIIVTLVTISIAVK